MGDRARFDRPHQARPRGGPHIVEHGQPLRRRPGARWAYAALAYIAVGLAMAGVVLPGLPTVPFLLLAAWAASRGSERLHAWLYEHPRFGQALIDWERDKAISRRTKGITVVLLASSWLIMYWRVGNPWLLAGLALLFGGVATFVLSRAEP